MAARLVEPEGDDYRLLGPSHAATVLDQQQERLERGRHAPPPLVPALSDAASRLLGRIVAMGYTFTGGREATYRLTYWGRERRFERTDQSRERETA